MAFAQLQTFNVNDGSFYVKNRSDFNGGNSFETGFYAPLLRSGNLSAGMNVGYVQNAYDLWKQNSWTSGMTFRYALKHGWSAYTKASTNFRGNWNQETGLRMTMFSNEKYNVGLNAGYIFDYPFRSNQQPGWTAGFTVSFPVKTLF